MVCSFQLPSKEVFMIQSNMELELKDCKNGTEMLRGDINPNVRNYYTQKITNMDDYFYEMENKTGWCEFSEENAKNWLAVGYIFLQEACEGTWDY